MTPSTNVATLPSGCSFTQAFAGEHRKGTWDDWVGHPDVTEHAYNEIGTRTDSRPAGKPSTSPGD